MKPRNGIMAHMMVASMLMALMLVPGITPADTPTKPAKAAASPVQLTTQGDNLKPCVTLRPAGGIYVSWAQRKSDSSAILFARSKDGVHIDTPVQVSGSDMQLDLGAEAGPNVAIDAKGRIYLAWAAGQTSNQNSNQNSKQTSNKLSVAPASGKTLSAGIPTSSGDENHAHTDTSHTDTSHTGHSGTSGGKHYNQPTDIWVARSEDDGRSFSKPVRVNDDAAPAVHRFPFLGVDATGGICVSWLDKRKKTAEGTDLTRVFFARSTDGARTFGKNLDATSGQPYPICHCCRVALTTDPRLGILIAFRNDIHDQRDMFLVRATEGGHDFSTPVALEQTDWKIPMCPMDGPSISVDYTGTLHAVWMTGGKVEGKPLWGEVEPANNKILYNRVSSASERSGSGSIGTPILLGAGHHPRLALADNGDAFVVWREKSILLARIPRSSEKTPPGIQVIKFAGDKDLPGYPALAVSRDRIIYCAWQQTMPDDSIQIYLARVPASRFGTITGAQITKSR